MANAKSEDFSNFTFHETVNYSQDLRAVLYDQLKSEYSQFNFTPISYSDAAQADLWQGHGRNEWSWKSAYSIYQRKSGFKRFDLSIKNGINVCGLSYGMPTKSKSKLKIDIIESTPYHRHKNNTKIFGLISQAAQYYALLLGANEVRIMNPLNEKLINHYCSYGYDYIQPRKSKIGNYCSINIEV